MIKCLECSKEFKVLKHTHFRFGCTGAVKSTAEYKLKYPASETVSVELRKKLAHSADAFNARYGENVGPIKWEQYRQKMSHKNSLDAFLAKGKTEVEWQAYNQSRAVTLANQISKHGESGEQRFREYTEKQRCAGNTLDYFVEKLGIEAGSKKYTEVCAAKGITLINMVRVHGSEQGLLKYNSWLEKTKGNYISLSGARFVKDIVEKIPNDFIFHDGVYSKEFCVWQDKIFMYDFVVTHPVKRAIEFNGDYWHANPKTYSATDIVPLRGNHKIAADIWANDAKKIALLEQRGYDVLTVWESDYLRNPQEIIEMAYKWITLPNE